MEAIHRAVLDHLTYLADHGLPMVTNKAIAEAVGCKTPHKVDNALQRLRHWEMIRVETATTKVRRVFVRGLPHPTKWQSRQAHGGRHGRAEPNIYEFDHAGYGELLKGRRFEDADTSKEKLRGGHSRPVPHSVMGCSMWWCA